MRSVADGVHELGPLLYHFDSYRECDKMLAWCIENNIIGKNLMGYWKIMCGNLPTQVAVNILSRVNKDKDQRILAGRDYVTDIPSGR
jgi:hypothetical protein